MADRFELYRIRAVQWESDFHRYYNMTAWESVKRRMERDADTVLELIRRLEELEKNPLKIVITDEMVENRVRIEFKPQDLWFGAFWKSTPGRLDIWVCLLPTLPIHYSRRVPSSIALER